jgi:hypothetical protein
MFTPFAPWIWVITPCAEATAKIEVKAMEYLMLTKVQENIWIDIKKLNSKGDLRK